MRELIARDASLWLSRSWTTRPPRPSESDDAYVFVDRAAFEAHIAAGGFLEHAEFLGNLYGSPVPEDVAGRDVILEIDVQGAQQVKQRLASALLIFMLPPSRDELERRMLGRGDDPAKVRERLDVADAERELARSLGAIEVVNDDFDEACDRVASLIHDARLTNQ